MSHSDYLKGYSAGQNNPGWSPKPQPETRTQVVTQYDNSTTLAAVIAIKQKDEIIKQRTAELVGQYKVVGALRSR